MGIKTTINTPENTLNYMKYVEIENDTRYPAVTGGQGQGVFNKSAILVQQVDPFNTNIGTVTGGQSNYIEKFGASLLVNGDLTTIYEGVGLYNYLTTASKISAVSTDSEDALNGDGARTIDIQGLDSNYNYITETLSCNPTDGTNGGAESINEYLRIYRASIDSAGGLRSNAGTINIESSTGPVIIIGTHGIGPNIEGFGQSQTSVYTIPAGKTGYVTQWSVGSSQSTAQVHAYLKFSEPSINGKLFRTKDVMFLNNYSIKDYKIPLKVAETTDIEVRAWKAGGTGQFTPVSTSYNVILVDN